MCVICIYIKHCICHIVSTLICVFNTKSVSSILKKTKTKATFKIKAEVIFGQKIFFFHNSSPHDADYLFFVFSDKPYLFQEGVNI